MGHLTGHVTLPKHLHSAAPQGEKRIRKFVVRRDVVCNGISSSKVQCSTSSGNENLEYTLDCPYSMLSRSDWLSDVRTLCLPAGDWLGCLLCPPSQASGGGRE